MQIFTVILLGFLIVCAISVSLSKNLLNSILIYMSYSLIMSIIWILLESPDLAITEAAVGAGITSVLFFLTLKKIHAMVDDETQEESIEEEQAVLEAEHAFGHEAAEQPESAADRGAKAAERPESAADRGTKAAEQPESAADRGMKAAERPESAADHTEKAEEEAEKNE